MRAYYTFVSAFYSPKCCEMVQFFFFITCIRLFQCTQCLELVYALTRLKIDEFSRAKMDAMAKELIGEASFAKSSIIRQVMPQ